MDTTQFYEELKAKAQEDFIDILANSNFIDGDTVELCEKITITKTMLDYIQDNLENGGTDIVALLFHKKPITAFYDWYKVKEISLLENLEEKISDFTISTKIDNEMAYAEPRYYSRYSVEKANEYHKFVASMEMDSDFEQVDNYTVESLTEDILKERYELLKERTWNDYNDILANTNFLDGDIEKLSLKIVLAKEMSDYIMILDGSYTDIESLLFLEKPVTAFYDNCIEKEVSVLEGVMDDINQFILDRKHHIQNIFNDPQGFNEEDVTKAIFFMAVREAMINVIENDIEEQDNDMER